MSRRRREGAPGRAGGEGARGDTKADDSNRSTSEGRFVVIELKSSGRRVEIGRYDSEAEAQSVVRLLLWCGAVARVEGPNGELPLDEGSR